MNTFIIERQEKPANRYYYLIKGNRSIRVKSGNLIENPEAVLSVANEYGKDVQFVLTNVKTQPESPKPFERVTIVSFDVAA